MNIVDVIKKECSLRGISIHSLEQELEIGGGTIGKWKKASPKAETVMKIAAYLDVTTDYLLGLTEEKNKPIPEDELDREILERMAKLSPAEQEKVAIFIEGMIASRK